MTNCLMGRPARLPVRFSRSPDDSAGNVLRGTSPGMRPRHRHSSCPRHSPSLILVDLENFPRAFLLAQKDGSLGCSTHTGFRFSEHLQRLNSLLLLLLLLLTALWGEGRGRLSYRAAVVVVVVVNGLVG